MDEERKRRNRRKKWKDWLGSWLMILPALCFLLVFTIYPMLNIVRLSFFKGNALKPLKQFVGLDNYRQLFFVKKDFLTALKNTARLISSGETRWSFPLSRRKRRQRC